MVIILTNELVILYSIKCITHIPVGATKLHRIRDHPVIGTLRKRLPQIESDVIAALLQHTSLFSVGAWTVGEIDQLTTRSTSCGAKVSQTKHQVDVAWVYAG